MKATLYPLLLAACTLLGCQSEAEKAHRQRMDALEAYYHEHATAVAAWEKGLWALHEQRNPQAPATQRERLDSLHRQRVQAVADNYPEIGTERRIWQALGFRPQPSQLMFLHHHPDRRGAESARYLVQDLQGIYDKKGLHWVMDRHVEGAWSPELANWENYRNEEERTERVAKVYAALDTIRQLRWLVGADPWLVVAPTFLSDSEYEGGELVATLRLYELSRGRIAATLDGRATPPYVSYVYGSSIAQKQRSLVDALPQDLFQEFKKSLEETYRR